MEFRNYGLISPCLTKSHAAQAHKRKRLKPSVTYKFTWEYYLSEKWFIFLEALKIPSSKGHGCWVVFNFQKTCWSIWLRWLKQKDTWPWFYWNGSASTTPGHIRWYGMTCSMDQALIKFCVPKPLWSLPLISTPTAVWPQPNFSSLWSSWFNDT